MARTAGIDVWLDHVPLREPDLEPWEVMISESQERMVAVVRPERLDDVMTVCRALGARRTPRSAMSPTTPRLRALHDGELLAASRPPR